MNADAAMPPLKNAHLLWENHILPATAAALPRRKWWQRALDRVLIRRDR